MGGRGGSILEPEISYGDDSHSTNWTPQVEFSKEIPSGNNNLILPQRGIFLENKSHQKISFLMNKGFFLSKKCPHKLENS